MKKYLLNLNNSIVLINLFYTNLLYLVKDFLLERCNLYIELGRTNELITKLGEAIELDPENSLLYFNRGTIYDQEGQTSEAEIDYLKAIELDPSSFGSNYNLGALFFNKAVELNNSANSTSDNNKYKKLKNWNPKKSNIKNVKDLILN